MLERASLILGALMTCTSDTTGSQLISALYNLARDPTQAEKIRQEVMRLGAETEYRELQDLPHLNGFINETFRLHAPIPSGMIRNTPPTGINIGAVHVPGNVTVVIPNWSLGRCTCPFFPVLLSLSPFHDV